MPTMSVTPIQVPTVVNDATATARSQTLYTLEIQSELTQSIIKAEGLLSIFGGLYLDLTPNHLQIVVLVTEQSEEVKNILVNGGVESEILEVREVQSSEYDLQQAQLAVQGWFAEEYQVEGKWPYSYSLDTPHNRINVTLHPQAWVQLSDFDPQGQPIPYEQFPIALKASLETEAPGVDVQLNIGELVITRYRNHSLILSSSLNKKCPC